MSLADLTIRTSNWSLAKLWRYDFHHCIVLSIQVQDAIRWYQHGSNYLSYEYLSLTRFLHRMITDWHAMCVFTIPMGWDKDTICGNGVNTVVGTWAFLHLIRQMCYGVISWCFRAVELCFKFYRWLVIWQTAWLQSCQSWPFIHELGQYHAM